MRHRAFFGYPRQIGSGSSLVTGNDSGVSGRMIGGESVLSGMMAMPTISKSLIPTDGGKHEKDAPPVHPGEILLEDFLKPFEITRCRLSKSIGVSQRRIGEIVAGMRAVTADTALRLARFFGADAQSWVNLQAHYDFESARKKLEGRLHKEVTPMTQVECMVAGGITAGLQKRAFV